MCMVDSENEAVHLRFLQENSCLYKYVRFMLMNHSLVIIRYDKSSL